MNRAMPIFHRILTGATAALLAALACGCGPLAPVESSYSQAPQVSAAPAGDQTLQTSAVPTGDQTVPQAPKGSALLGVWEGTIFARRSSERGRTGAQQVVTITLLEGKNSLVTGYYKCAYGNQTCLGQNTTGDVVAASLDGPNILIRVKLPDGTSSLLRGHVVNSTATGNYFVYAGGGVLEYGEWRARHSY
jgi:hypothetical protein